MVVPFVGHALGEVLSRFFLLLAGGYVTPVRGAIENEGSCNSAHVASMSARGRVRPVTTAGSPDPSTRSR